MKEIVFVDDQASMRDLFAINAESAGVCCAVLGDALACVEYVRENSYNVLMVLADMHMPQMDGLMLARNLESRYPKIPVVIQTADTSDWRCGEALCLQNVKGIMDKVCTKKDLFRAIQTAFRST